jgi:hypothetical protein
MNRSLPKEAKEDKKSPSFRLSCFFRLTGGGAWSQRTPNLAWRHSTKLAKEFLTQSRQDAKKRRPDPLAPLRLCVSLPVRLSVVHGSDAGIRQLPFRIPLYALPDH